jgi:hypothetical protein
MTPMVQKAKRSRFRRLPVRFRLPLSDNLSHAVVIGRHGRFQLIGVVRLGEARPSESPGQGIRASTSPTIALTSRGRAARHRNGDRALAGWR